MMRTLMFALLFSAWPTANAAEPGAAAEYVVRMETVGFEDAPVAKEGPEEKVLRSVEAIARPGKRFRARTKIGREEIVLAGTMNPGKGDEFTVRFVYSYSFDTGQKIPNADGTFESFLSKTSMESAASLSLNEPTTVGGNGTRTSGEAGPVSRSSLRYVLLLEEHKPSRGKAKNVKIAQE